MAGGTPGGVTLSAKDLAGAMASATSIVTASVVIPQLANARLTAGGDTLEIVTSDLDIEFCQRVKLAGDGAISTTVDARMLKDMAGMAEGGAQISLTPEDQRMTVKTGRSRWVLPMLPADDFPAMAFASGSHRLELPGTVLARLIARTVCCASKEIVRSYLCGVSLDCEDGRFTAIGTDGHRAMRVISDRPWPDGAPPVIVPTKLARTIEKIAADWEGPVTIEWNERMLQAVVGDVAITGKLMVDPVPPWRNCFTFGTEGMRVAIDPALLLAAVRRVDLTGNPKTRAVRFERHDGQVTVATPGNAAGEGFEEVSAECTAGSATGINAQYAEAVLGALGGDSIEIWQLDEPKAPLILRRVVDDGALAAVFPMAV